MTGSKRVRIVLLLIAASVSAAARQTPKPTPTGATAAARQPPTHAPTDLGMSIGDIQIRNYSRSSLNIRRLSDITFEGPGVVITPRDPNRPTTFRVVADKVVGHKLAGKPPYTVVELSGNIHYTLTQHLKGGTRVVSGTAGSAVYDQRAGHIRLTAGVEAEMTDPAALEGPAHLRAGAVLLPTAPDRPYLMSGAPGQNDLTFTPREPTEPTSKVKPAKKSSSSSQGFSGPIHLHGFRAGALSPDREAQATGENTVLDLADPKRGMSGRIEADVLTVGYAPGTRKYEARENVRYHLSQPEKEGGVQSVTGTSNAAAYDGVAERLTLTGAVNAVLEDPAALLHPAHLHAERAVMQRLPDTVGKDGKPTPPNYRYTLEGGPAHALLQFQMKPQPKKETAVAPAPQSSTAPNSAAPGKPSAPAFSIGMVEVIRFVHGEFTPGRDVEFTGKGVTFSTRDPQARTAARLQGDRLTARFADDRTLSRMAATGLVKFHIEQPSGEDKKLQIITGSGSEADFSNTATAQLVTLQGPLQVQVDSPASETPALITDDDKRGKIIYNLTLSDLQQDSPNKTGRIRFVPRASKTARAGEKGKTPPGKPARPKH